MKRLLIIFAIVLLFGCGGMKARPEQVSAGTYPSNYESIIKDHLQEALFDPDSLKDFSIDSPPTLIVLTSGYPKYDLLRGQEVYECKYVWYNAKNRMGGYTGKKPHIYFIRQGRVVAVW